MSMEQMKLPELIDKYVQIRDAKDAAKKVFTNSTQRMTDALVKLDGLILAALDKEGLESAPTDAGTAYKKNRSSCSVKDRDAFYNFAVSTGNLEAIDMKANAKIVRELLDGGIDVPGVKYSESIFIGVRRAT